MRIKAAVLEEFGAPLAIRDVELAEPRAGEVLVRLVACGVCHTDLYTASGADPSGYAPAVLGHEGAGVVERVGEGVTSVAAGDHVVTLFSPQCRECVHCLSDRTNLCLAIREQQNKGYLPDGTARLSLDGEPVRHFMGTSTFAEYTVMPEIALAGITPEAPLHHACLFACGLSTGLGAAMNTAKVDVPMKCRIGSPSRENRVVPSGRWPRPCCSRIARQRFVLGLRQWMHSRHCGENSVTTWSPGATELTPSPTRSTTPAPSCPRTVGA